MSGPRAADNRRHGAGSGEGSGVGCSSAARDGVGEARVFTLRSRPPPSGKCNRIWRIPFATCRGSYASPRPPDDRAASRKAQENAARAIGYSAAKTEEKRGTNDRARCLPGLEDDEKMKKIAISWEWEQEASNFQNHSLSAGGLGFSHKGREFEDPATKAYMKAMSARALWHLARGEFLDLP
nr:putative armadillo repeat only 2 [Ipomoea batatas]